MALCPSSSDVLAAQSIQPELQKYLEAVFAVAPYPAEYVRYRLHLATTLPLELLDAWFEQRRHAAKEYEHNTNFQLRPTQDAPLEAGSAAAHAHGQGFSLFANKNEAAEPGGKGVTTSEEHDVGRLLAMMQNGPALDSVGNSTANSLRGPSDLSEEAEKARLAAAPRCADVATLADQAGSDSCNAAASTRFTEADLDVISNLVGLETISSQKLHCGSHSLYMFEQLTALDSLDPEHGSGAKRKRTRHQHFWRNTDKLDPQDRVYVPTSSLRPALDQKQLVQPKSSISPDERTNSWTVCLTTTGVVGYLNKRISPLGVRLIRALARKDRSAKQESCPAKILPLQDGDLDCARRNLGAGLAPKQPSLRAAGQLPTTSNADIDSSRESRGSQMQLSVSPELESDNSNHSEGSQSRPEKQHTLLYPPGSKLNIAAHINTNFEPIPRARKRKPG